MALGSEENRGKNCIEMGITIEKQTELQGRSSGELSIKRRYEDNEMVLRTGKANTCY